MLTRNLGFGAAAILFAVGCGNGSGSSGSGGGGAGSTSNGAGAAASSGTSAASSGTSSAASSGSTSASSGSASSSASGSSSSSGGNGAVTAQELLAKVAACAQLPGTTKFATDDGEANTIPVCGLNGAVWWQADMDVDCDGKMTAQCNKNTDPAYQNQTSATDSNGNPLDAASLPFVVVPLPGNGFNYNNAGLKLGGVIAVIYNGQLNYGVFGDEGPNNIIGESSYAMAKSLGIDPDPSTGGVDCTNNGTKCPVTYIAFTGANTAVSPIEDHNKALSVGDARAKQFLMDNP